MAMWDIAGNDKLHLLINCRTTEFQQNESGTL